MNKIKKTLQIIISVLISTFAIYAITFAWIAPSSTPPANNVAAPINSGSTAQNKTGDLTIGGNVGIGITNPTAKLQVMSDGYVSLTLGRTGATSGGNAINYLGGGASTQYNWQVGKNITTQGAFEFVPSTSPDGTSFTTPVVVILQNGNVGIGTTAPGAKLEVAGTVKITGGTPGAGKILTSDANGLASWISPSSSQWTTSGSNIYYNLGNVGIGTSAPNNKLQVFGLISFDDINHNTALGSAAFPSNTSGQYNTAIGSGSLPGNTTGSYNIAIGSGAGNGNTTGWGNVNVGYNSWPGGGVSGNTNVFIGYNSGNNVSQKLNPVNSIAIGSATYTTADNQVVLGNSSITQTLLNGNVGIGTTAPTAKLQIGGTAGVDGIKFPDGTTQTTAAVSGTSQVFSLTGIGGLYDIQISVGGGNPAEIKDSRLVQSFTLSKTTNVLAIFGCNWNNLDTGSSFLVDGTYYYATYDAKTSSNSTGQRFIQGNAFSRVITLPAGTHTIQMSFYSLNTAFVTNPYMQLVMLP